MFSERGLGGGGGAGGPVGVPVSVCVLFASVAFFVCACVCACVFRRVHDAPPPPRPRATSGSPSCGRTYTHTRTPWPEGGLLGKGVGVCLIFVAQWGVNVASVWASRVQSSRAAAERRGEEAVLQSLPASQRECWHSTPLNSGGQMHFWFW